MNILSPIETIGTKIYTNIFTNFLHFIITQKILQLGSAFIIGINISNFVTIIVNNIFTPIINRFYGPETGTTTIPFINRTYSILGIQFGYGLVISGLLQFIIILYIVYILYLITEDKKK